MRAKAKYLIVLFCFPVLYFAQLRIIKPVKTETKKSNIGIGVGVARSVLYLTRNTANNNDAYGFYSVITYDRGNFLRAMLEYTNYSYIDIKPTWYNVKAQTVELNLAVIAKNKSKTLFFYPLLGLSYNIFNGYYTGVNDYLHLQPAKRNSDVTSVWIGLNTGLGLEYNYRHISFFWNCKMRTGKTEGINQYNIMDVFNVIGIRYNLNQVSLHKIFRGTRSRYSLDKKPPTK